MTKGFLDFELIGAKELEANLLALPLATQKNVVDRALRRAGAPMQKAGQRNSKRSVKKAGGHFPRVLEAKKVSRSQRTDAARTIRNGDRVIYIGARPSPVAHLFEYGTKKRRTRKGANRGRMKAEPYMGPAFEATWRPVLDSLGKALGAEIEKAAARLARRTAKARAKA